MPNNQSHILDLGPMPYLPAWNLQKQIQARLIADKRSADPEHLPHVVLLVEHPHVYTLGKSGKAENLLLSEAALTARGATFHHIGRGGDITYHGPGQLVGYPILDLDRFFTDLGKYLRLLEETIIRTCADYGITTGRVPGRTGVWVGPDENGPERKICAMGIRCSRWVTMHGFALNINTDLTYFNHIIPCGITDRGVTSLAKELGHPVEEDDVRRIWAGHFSTLFETEIEYLKGENAFVKCGVRSTECDSTLEPESHSALRTPHS